ncbi:DUF3108 domain-containing protein, partial [candidate division KSB1 bacterium]|nr:DUF3108 domain-containing protein [candidate division KSB1 bacterium]
MNYRVMWGIIPLGTMRIDVVEKIRLDGFPVYQVTWRVDSNPLLFFINIHESFESFIDSAGVFSRKFLAHSADRERTYHFDYIENRLTMDTFLPDGSRVRDTINIQDKIQDGTSLLFYIRSQVHKSKKEEITTVIEQELMRTDVYFANKLVRIKGAGGDVDAI